MTFIGISAYSLMNPRFPYKRLMKCFPKNIKHPALALLWGTFGDNLKGIKAFCDLFADREHLLEVHISNECSRRSGRDGKEIAPTLSVKEYGQALAANDRAVKMQVRARVADVLASLRPSVTNSNTQIMLSAGLESDLPGGALTVLHRVVKRTSKLPLVYSADGHAAGLFGANYIESHSTTPNSQAAFWNLDGTSLDFHDGEKYSPKISPAQFFENFKEFKDHMEAVFLWSAYQQGLSGLGLGGSYWGRSYVVTDEAISGMKELLREMGNLL